METVGWVSADLHRRHNGEDHSATKNIAFSRRYLDPNRVTFEYHNGRGNFSFGTTWGRSITKGSQRSLI
jgi:hypothetical protein